MGSTTGRPDDSGTDSGRAAGEAAPGRVVATPTVLDTVAMQFVALRASLDAIALQLDALAGSYAAAVALVRSAGTDPDVETADRVRESVDALRATLNLDATKPRRFFGDTPAAAHSPGVNAAGIT